MIFLSAAAACMAAAAETLFPLNLAGDAVYQWGTGKQENYDIALRISDPALAGSEIRSIQVNGIATDGISGFSVWISSELKLESNKNVPDILSAEATPDGNTLTFKPATTVSVPEGGLYVGYSFAVDKLTEAAKAPVSVAKSDNPDALLIHTNRSYRSWGNYNLGLAADITVTLAGDFNEYAVTVDGISEEGLLVGGEASSKAILRNRGLLPVSSIEYTVGFAGGDPKSFSKEFDPALPAAYDRKAELELDLGLREEYGSFPYTLTVTKVNGRPNADAAPAGEGRLYVYPWLPVHRPLLEEYTGLWCGWCPRGAIGLELMEKAYPEDFIYVAYHIDDVMAIVTQTTCPTEYTGAPSVNLDRHVAGDPYYGLKSNVPTVAEGLGELWNSVRASDATAEISLSADWTDDSRSAVTAKADVRFVRDYPDADIRIVYLLTSTIQDDSMRQSNYLSGMEEFRGTDLEPLVDKPKYILGPELQNVAVLTPSVFGVEGSLPSDIRLLDEYSHSATLSLADALNTDGNPIPLRPETLAVVAAVYDARSGRILNAARTKVCTAGIGEVESDDSSTLYFNLQGIPVADPDRGVYIRVQDGRSSKVIF